MQILRIRVRVEGDDGASAEVETEIHGASGPDDARDAVRQYREALRAALGASAPQARRDDQADADQLRPRGGAPPERSGGGGAGGGEEIPETGRELIAWAGDRDLKNRVYKLGKAWKFPDKVLDWRRDEVRAVYDELRNEAARQAPRAARRNGYAGARS